eukprot:TRINITY_DN5455_c1_g1_i1.p1 TRINITY_DN5455_c1_g1~~TRINITY_DN5455_c1_g1_i1.p1  ORF type:complete len:351 (+),score=97.77 TRINITY_DN5455_c1_g1_i1:94-1146(+)
MRAVALAAAAAAGASACSEFWANDQYKLSGRTMDLGSDMSWTMISVPRGRKFSASAPGLKTGVQWTTKYGVLGVGPGVPDVPVPGFGTFQLFEGLNEAGVSGSFNALENSSFPTPTNSSRALGLLDTLLYMLTNHGTVAECVEALESEVQVWPGIAGIATKDLHLALRDADGHSAVVEWVGGKQVIYKNDAYGIMTNEPTLDFHLKNMQYLDWKHSLTRQAVEVPGAFYPAERFARVHLIKQSLVPPKNYQEAVTGVVHMLNSVNVPNGMWGTDTGSSTEGKQTDHTWWSVVRDHKNKVIFFRTVNNQMLQRVALSEVPLAPGSKPMVLNIDAVPGDWYVSARPKFTPRV